MNALNRRILQYKLLVIFALGTLLPQPSFANQIELKIMTEDLPPFNYVENGELKGPVVKLVREIVKRLGRDHAIRVVPWPRAYAMAQKEPGCVLFSTVRSPGREKLFKWVGPVARFDLFLFKKRGSPITVNSLNDARKYLVGAQFDSAGYHHLCKLGFPKLELDYSENYSLMVRMLMAGRIDLWLAPMPSARQVAAKSGVDPKGIEPVLAVASQVLYIAFSKSTPEHEVNRWQELLDELKRDGIYDDITGLGGVH